MWCGVTPHNVIEVIMLILLGGEKGGTGKTTLAVNLAVRRALDGGDVLLIDCDRQKSATQWVIKRDAEGQLPEISLVEKTGGNIDKEIARQKKKYQDIIVDAGGHDSDELRSALLGVDKVFIPIKPSSFDAWTLEEMGKHVRRSRVNNRGLKAYVFFNMAPTNPKIKELEEVNKAIKELEGVTFCPHICLRERVIYQITSSAGFSILEQRKKTEEKTAIRKDSKAISEFETLYREVFNVIP